MSKCRPGCPTQDHESYAACCRGIQFNTGMLLTTRQKADNTELKAYAEARRQGVQPLGTKMAQVEHAMKASDASGVAYNGGG